MYPSMLVLVLIMVAGVLFLDGYTGLFDARPRGAHAPVVHVDDAEVDREIEIRAGRGGHFLLEAEVNGETIEFMVDTGATSVALSPADAARLGYDDTTLEYTGRARTANGIARFAPLTLDTISIGPLTVRDVSAAVIERPMAMSLLGMSFLDRLEGFEARDGRLVLRW